MSFAVQLLLSLIAVVGVAALVRAMGLGTPQPIRDAAHAMQLAEDAEPDFVAVAATVAADGCSAHVTGSDGRSVLVRQHGNHFAVRDGQEGTR